MSRAVTINDDGEWVPSIPVPVYMAFFNKCPECRQRFWTMHGYQGHYALFHILKLGRRR